MTARFIVADVYDGLAQLAPGSVDLVLTSPPFLALRSYLPDDHEHKGREIGSEANPAGFIDAMLDVVEACDRVLAPHGSIAFELGDTYSGTGGAGGDWSDSPKTTLARIKGGGVGGPTRRVMTDEWPLAKSLCFIPSIFGASLAYGRNLLRPERTTPRWRVRNLVVWCRPNPPVGALSDKFRPASSYVTVATKSSDRYFDLDAVRVDNPRSAEVRRSRGELNRGNPGFHTEGDDAPVVQNEAGAPPRDYWVIPTSPYKGSHYATFPEELCVRPIAAMCPERVCTTCGEASRRIVETTHDVEHNRARRLVEPRKGWNSDRQDGGAGSFATTTTTVGWTDCGHGTWRNGCVLDPFAGSGTTLAVATGHGRDAVGIDLDARNAELARQRVGMFLTIDEPVTQ
jgi:DNA modification methylase